MNPTCLLPNTSSWVNLPTSFSLPPSRVNENLCTRYFIILYFIHPHEVAMPCETEILHQRQYPLAIIISERENGSLTYARHVRNLQAPFVDASPIRMVSPLRMQPSHFHRCQSSCARFLQTFCTKTIHEYSNHKGQLSDMEKECLHTWWCDYVFGEMTWWKQSNGGKIILMMCHQCKVGGGVVFAFLQCAKKACVYVGILDNRHQTPDWITETSRGQWASGAAAAASLLQDPTSGACK